MQYQKRITPIEILVLFLCITTLCLSLGAVGGKTREHARRLQCTAQLTSISHAISQYHNDYHGQNPTVYGTNDADRPYFGSDYYNSLHDPIAYRRWCYPDWRITAEEWQDPRNWPEAWRALPKAGGGLYILVKMQYILPRVFTCPSAPNDIPLDISPAKEEYADHPDYPVEDYTDLRDFCSMYNLSYAYHDPFRNNATAYSNPAMPILADKNPRFDTEEGEVRTQTDYGDDGDVPCSLDDLSTMNSFNHNQEGQNVLFVDGSVRFCNLPNVGLNNDNIYTYWSCIPPNLPEDITFGDYGPDDGCDWDELSQHPDDTFLGN